MEVYYLCRSASSSQSPSLPVFDLSLEESRLFVRGCFILISIYSRLKRNNVFRWEGMSTTIIGATHKVIFSNMETSPFASNDLLLEYQR